MKVRLFAKKTIDVKILFISSTALIYFLMKKRFRATYDDKHDSTFHGYRLLTLIVPSFILGCIFPQRYDIFEILWTFSLFLESVAILPQLFLLTSKGGAETITAHYIFTLGAYRAMYILNWIYRYFTQGYAPYVAWVTGFIQTLLYVDFFYHYVTKVLQGEKFVLPK